MKKEFIRVRSVKDYTIVASLIAAGLLLAVIPESDALATAGCFLVFGGIILALCLKTGYKDTETGILYKKTEKYFQQDMHTPVADAIGSKPGSIDLSQADKGNAIKLDIYFSTSTGKAYLQLFEYVPYKYEPCSAVYEHSVNDVTDLIRS